MAENADGIELKDLGRERETQQVIQEEETSFIDDRRPSDESILITDGSNTVFTRVDAGRPSTSGIPNVGRDVGVMRRHIIHDMKQFFKKGLGLTINKGDGPNSTIIYDGVVFTTDKSNKINGATYKGKKILILKDGKLIYSTDKTKAQLVNEFKELLKKADAEHRKTPTPIAEKRAGVDLPQNVMNSIMENVIGCINIEVNRIAEEILSGTEIDKDELRELRGYLFDKDDMIVDGVDLREETLKHVEAVEIPFIEGKANEAKAEGKERKAALYGAMKRAAE